MHSPVFEDTFFFFFKGEEPLENIPFPSVHGSLPQAEGHSKLAGEGSSVECVSLSVVSYKHPILTWRCTACTVQEGVCE